MFLCHNCKMSKIKLLQSNTQLLIAKAFAVTFSNFVKVKVHVKKEHWGSMECKGCSSAGTNVLWYNPVPSSFSGTLMVQVALSAYSSNENVKHTKQDI